MDQGSELLSRGIEAIAAPSQPTGKMSRTGHFTGILMPDATQAVSLTSHTPSAGLRSSEAATLARRIPSGGSSARPSAAPSPNAREWETGNAAAWESAPPTLGAAASGNSGLERSQLPGVNSDCAGFCPGIATPSAVFILALGRAQHRLKPGLQTAFGSGERRWEFRL